MLNKKGKACMGLIPKEIKQVNPQPATSCAPDMIRRVKVLISGSNPATQRVIANKLGMSLKTVNTIINKDLNMEKCHKSRVALSYVRALHEQQKIVRKSSGRRKIEICGHIR